MAQKVKSLPAMQETGVQSLSQEDPLEKEIAAHSSILVWKIPWMEGVPDLPVAPQDEAGLTKTFQTWPRGWFHIP